MDNFIHYVYIDWEEIPEDSYLRDIAAFQNVEKLSFQKPVTFFVGENGSGKSTLLEAIAISWGFNAEGGTKNYAFSTFDSHSDLNKYIRLSRGTRKVNGGYFLRAESFYNVATQEQKYADDAHPSRRFHEKSHGEAFLSVVQTQFRPNGLYLLDEPESALSPQRQLTLLLEIYRCIQEGAQFIIVTHSPILLGMPDAEIFTFDKGMISLCNYEETDSYQVTKLFINNHKQMLHQLFCEEE